MKVIETREKTEASAVAPISPAVLLRPEQLAEKLAVPVSWVREKTRQRARKRDEDPLPVIRLGKYVRFNWGDVQAWLTRQSER